jgi:hypothetical protein
MVRKRGQTPNFVAKGEAGCCDDDDVASGAHSHQDQKRTAPEARVTSDLSRWDWGVASTH